MMRYLVLILTLVLAASCGHDSETTSSLKDAGVLNIYVYPADDPMVTRGDEGLISAKVLENAVKSLKIWVFKHAGGAATDLPLHYLAPAEPELQGMQGSRAKLFQIALTEEQVKAITGDGNQVDVYVLTNAESIGLGTLNGSSKRSEVRDAVIASGYFGTTSLTTDISEAGLPMAGCAENISVQGSYPVLSLPVVKLTRCVSKIRFVMAQNKDVDAQFFITSIQLHGNQFPETEHVFNTTANPYYISDGYVPDPVSITPPDSVKKTERIFDLVYKSQQIQDYEDILDKFVADGEVSQLGPYYFRESDKRLSGTIRYRIEENNQEYNKTVNFQMNEVPGNYNFSRNHSWIVYVYYLGGEELRMLQVYIRSWEEAERERDLFNW